MFIRVLNVILRMNYVCTSYELRTNSKWTLVKNTI